MTKRARLLTSLAAAAPFLLASTAAVAGGPASPAPGPGVIALIAAGVVGAIVIARRRK